MDLSNLSNVAKFHSVNGFICSGKFKNRVSLHFFNPERCEVSRPKLSTNKVTQFPILVMMHLPAKWQFFTYSLIWLFQRPRFPYLMFYTSLLRWLHNELQVAVLGPQLDLSYTYEVIICICIWLIGS